MRTDTPDSEYSEDDGEPEGEAERRCDPETQGETPTAQSAMTGSSEIVLVQVENTPFRLPRRQLMEASGVFNEILGGTSSLSGTPAKNKTSDPEQVVKITGVLAKDFRTTMEVCAHIE